MGYYTRHVLDIENDECDYQEVIKYMVELNDKDSDKFYPFEYELEDFKNNKEVSFPLDDPGESKWYEHTNEMLDLSKAFPNVVFKIHGEGEDNGDIWDEYYKDGKMQRCEAEIVMPPFDERKLC